MTEIITTKKGGKTYYSAKSEGKTIKVEKKDLNKREFKHYIEEKGYYFGVKAYKDRVNAPRIGKRVSDIETKTFISEGNFTDTRIISKFKYGKKEYTATSHYIPKGKKEAVERKKIEADENLAYQIVARKHHLKGYLKDEIDDNYSDEFDAIKAKIRGKSTYTYMNAT